MCTVAGEVVTLTTGLELKADRFEVDGTSIVLRAGEGRTILPRSAVASIETIPDLGEPQPVQRAAPELQREIEQTPRELVRDAAQRHGLPADFVEAVAKTESGLNPKAISPKGAIGLMQLMPATAREAGVDPHDPEQNAEGGAKLLRGLLIEYQAHPDQVRRALAAYNAGPGAVKKYNGVPPYRETMTYVDRVLRQYARNRAIDSD